MLKMRIDFKSLIRKKPDKINDDFMVALITGTQGSGKSYFAIYHNEKDHNHKIIYTNIKSYKSLLSLVYFLESSSIMKIQDVSSLSYNSSILSKYFTSCFKLL